MQIEISEGFFPLMVIRQFLIISSQLIELKFKVAVLKQKTINQTTDQIRIVSSHYKDRLITRNSKIDLLCFMATLSSVSIEFQNDK